MCVCVCVCVFSSPPPSRSPGRKHRSPPSWPDWGSADLGSAGCGSLGQNGQHATEREYFVFFTKDKKKSIFRAYELLLIDVVKTLNITQIKY